MEQNKSYDELVQMKQDGRAMMPRSTSSGARIMVRNQLRTMPNCSWK